MIEDDLRAVIGQNLAGVETYARLIPLDLPVCVCVQAIGGTPSPSSIRRARHIISVMAVSDNRETSDRLLRQARDILTSSLPYSTADAHYYYAHAIQDGRIEQKRPSPGGVAYISFVDMEVLASL